MDILDIDEALKDDSFIFLEDKTHDDISNILQQWKSNNCLPPSINRTPQQPLEQPYKLDSRTFTRPKRKLVQNLESSHFAHSSNQNAQQITENPMLNLEIGGLVTTMEKSYLQDTSPPSFISMDASTDRMNNSLITSADFSNLNFLQSTNSLDFNAALENGECVFNLNDKATSDGYTLSDMIRDRKALESLTMSSDGTLIKDSHIGQIDDISLNLSKTASGCSTMDNSTESVEGANRTIRNLNMDRTLDLGACNNFKTGNENLHRTMVLADEMIGDITYNLVESGTYGNTVNEKPSAIINRVSSKGSAQSSNEEKPSALDETKCLSTFAAVKAVNTTFDLHLNVTPDGTPECLEKNMAAMTCIESTPHTTTLRPNKKLFTPPLELADNISLKSGASLNLSDRKFNETFDLNESKGESKTKPINAEIFMGKLLDTQQSMEMIDDIESPHETLNRTYRCSVNENTARKEMQNVMDLAEAEANLLASNNNEEEFDHMLNEFSKVELNAEQLKMKKSLDSIKKRFNYSSCREKSHNETSSSTDDESHHSKENLNATISLRNGHDNEEQKPFNERLTECSPVLNETTEIQKNTSKECTSGNMNDSKSSIHLSNGLNVSYVNSSSNSSERLLSRRSRLYDDINLLNITTSNPRLPLTSTSFTLPKDDSATRANETNETEYTMNTMGSNNYQSDDVVVATVVEECEIPSDGTDIIPRANYNQDSQVIHYRLAEKRERDRDRFKTINITKNRSGGDEAPIKPELNVPCIDDCYDQQLQLDIEKDDSQPNSQRNSRCDGSDSPVSYNNESTADTENASKVNTNYLTYRKPREKQSVIRNLPEVAPLISTAAPTEQSAAKPRSLSRPRYISGLTKFSAVSKATSADELEKTVHRQTNANTKTSGLGGPTKISGTRISVNVNKTKGCSDLKSPMGIKSKSFHNLSGNITGVSAINNNSGVSTATKTFGLRKPNSIGSGLVKPNQVRHSTMASPNNLQQQAIQQKKDDSVFKVPKLVSGIRTSGSGGTNGVPKRAGLVRPSSGYYSLNVTAKSAQHPTGDLESDIERHSPTDSMSSASSSHSLTKQSQAVKPPNAIAQLTAKAVNVPANLTKVTIGSTGIPKPSGLRPPSNIKRSGLPRPSSFIKAEK
ncbi:short spindle 2 isoform 2-T4 [Glossina fuscipes fuscipes]